MATTTYLHQLSAAGELVAVGYDADIDALDVVEMTRTRRDGKTYRTYYRVWEMPYGQKFANTERRIVFNGWKVTTSDPFGYAEFPGEIHLPRCEAEGSFSGRLNCGVTNIYRMAV